MNVLKALCVVALCGLAACGNPNQPPMASGPVCPQNCPPLESVAVPPGSSVLVLTPSTTVSTTKVVSSVPQRVVARSVSTTSTVIVPTKRVIATVTPIPPTVGTTVVAEIDVPRKVGKAPPGAVRSSQVTWIEEQFDCGAHGGTRGVNPSTGKTSCLINDGPTK